MGKTMGVSRGKAANCGEVSSARYMESLPKDADPMRQVKGRRPG
jgi:hypothetical protein